MGVQEQNAWAWRKWGEAQQLTKVLGLILCLSNEIRVVSWAETARLFFFTIFFFASPSSLSPLNLMPLLAMATHSSSSSLQLDEKRDGYEFGKKRDWFVTLNSVFACWFDFTISTMLIFIINSYTWLLMFDWGCSKK